jgi:hypothetical protein
MRRWLQLWLLRRRRDALYDRVDWLREHISFGQVMLDKAEADLREAQAALWCAQTPESLIRPHRTASGFQSRR